MARIEIHCSDKQEAYRLLNKMEELKGGNIFASDVGLNKTAEVLAISEITLFGKTHGFKVHFICDDDKKKEQEE